MQLYNLPELNVPGFAACKRGSASLQFLKMAKLLNYYQIAIVVVVA